MRIDSFNTDDRVLIVAEIGNNHEGDFELAKRLVYLAAEAGADAVKFQTFVPEHYSTVLDQARQARLNQFRLSFDQFAELKKVADACGVIFISTPFDLASAEFLCELCPAVKISSSDNTFYPLLKLVAQSGKPIILSTGLADFATIGKAVECFRLAWQKAAVNPGLALLHCIAAYPVPPEDVNLAVIQSLRSFFACTPGYSDHTLGIEAAALAVAHGARIVEKHFTLDKHYSDFRDHELSADPAEFRAMVERIRLAEQLAGVPYAKVAPSEAGNTQALRRSIVPVRDLPAGTVIGEEDITWVRPGGGIPPGNEEQVIGHRLRVARRAGEQILPDDLEDAS